MTREVNIMQIQKDCADQQVVQRLDAVLAEVGGGLAPFDPYLHWSLNKRCCFFSIEAAQVVREYAGGLTVVCVENVFYIARRFMNTRGWFWSCVALLNAQADDHMLVTMMDGAA
jgi:hypothetical protein